VSWGCAPGELLAAGCAGAVDAYRTISRLGNVVREVIVGLLRCCCGSLLGRVHMDKEVAAAVDEGASIAGGKRLAKALAGHKALRVSILSVSRTTAGRRRGVANVFGGTANFPSGYQ
jgi:hypothetical protein